MGGEQLKVGGWVEWVRSTVSAGTNAAPLNFLMHLLPSQPPRRGGGEERSQLHGGAFPLPDHPKGRRALLTHTASGPS